MSNRRRRPRHPQPLNNRRHRPPPPNLVPALYSIGFYDPDGEEIEITIDLNDPGADPLPRRPQPPPDRYLPPLQPSPPGGRPWSLTRE